MFFFPLINAISKLFFGIESLYDLIFLMTAIVLVLFIPVVILDSRYATKSRMKGKLEHKDLELLEKDVEIKQRDIELQKRELEIIKLKQQREQITEDDIVLSQQKHVCLVHKGPIQGFSFICPECGTFYCQKCVYAISAIDNECWSCGELIDPDSDVIPEKKYDDITVERSDRDLVEQTLAKTKFCESCGAILKPKDGFCTECGSRQN